MPLSVIEQIRAVVGQCWAIVCHLWAKLGPRTGHFWRIGPTIEAEPSRTILPFLAVSIKFGSSWAEFEQRWGVLANVCAKFGLGRVWFLVGSGSNYVELGPGSAKLSDRLGLGPHV